MRRGLPVASGGQECAWLFMALPFMALCAHCWSSTDDYYPSAQHPRAAVAADSPPLYSAPLLIRARALYIFPGDPQAVRAFLKMRPRGT